MTTQFRESRNARRFTGWPHDRQRTINFRIHSFSAGSALSTEKIRLLPTTADSFYNDDEDHEVRGWTSTLRALLTGTRSECSPLSLLRNHERTIVRNIYGYFSNEWAQHVKLTLPAALVGNLHDTNALRFSEGRDPPGCFNREVLDWTIRSSGFERGFVAFSKCGHLEFPEPTGLVVSMLPFILGDENSLPDGLEGYYPLIEECPYLTEEVGKVGYLTVHECYVGAGDTQRRPGLHIESPGFFSDDPNAAAFTPGQEHPWGEGFFFGPDHYEGGIYFASSVDNTSQVFDALVDRNVEGIVDRHGGCEHLRGIVGDGTELEAGELVWMTDCTPHEALPQDKPGYRQFFRLVMPCVSHWYADHSTPNPKVNLPDCVTVIQGDKFA